MTDDMFVRVPKDYPGDVPAGFYRVTERNTEGERIDYVVRSLDDGEQYLVDGWKVLPAEMVDSTDYRRALGFAQQAHRLLDNLRAVNEQRPEKLRTFIRDEAMRLLEEMEEER